MARDIRIRIDDKLCKTCRKCLAAKACNVRAIVRIDADEAPYLEMQRCYDCRICLPVCPFGAIVLAA